MKLPVFKPQDKILLKRVFKIAQENKVKLYLVGGFLRDIFLGREKENPDIDFCLKRNAINFGRKVARGLSAGFVVLDKTHGCSRAVKRIKDKTYTLDFTDFRGRDLQDDLLHRDFTINAFALALKDIFQNKKIEQAVFDPYAGIRDLKLKAIRMINRKGFDEDPLRILRAFSLAAIFGFNIDGSTLKAIKSKKAKLSKISYERIRDELFKILDRPDTFNYLERLDELKILKIIIPEGEAMRGVQQGPYHHLDVLQHSLESVKQIDILIKKFSRPSSKISGGIPQNAGKNNKEMRDYLDEVISGERKRRALIKLGAFLHDIGKPAALRHEEGKTIFHGHERIGLEITENIVKRLRLSNDELDALRKMVFWHLRPGYMSDNDDLSARAIFRYFRDTGKEAVSTLLISLADQRSTRGPLTSEEGRLRHEKLVFRLLKEYFRRKKEKKLPRLVTGNDLMKKLKLEPSVLIGRILSEIEELQAIGKIKTKKEALKVAADILKRGKK